MKLTTKQIWIFITSVTFFATLMYIDFIFSKANFIEEKNKILEQKYSTYTSFRKNISDLLIDDTTENKKTQKILFDLMNNPEDREKYKNELYKQYKERFIYLKNNGFDCFHFHDTKGKSILRFQKTYKYNDLLIENRASIKEIITNKKPIYGIETGTLAQRYQSIYPIFYNNIYVGSVEISSSLSQVAKELNKNFIGNYLFLTKKNFIDSMIKKDLIKKQYYESWIEDYYINKTSDNHFFSDVNLKDLGKTLNIKLKNDEIFSMVSLDSINTSTIYTFLPIVNLNNKYEGYLVSQDKIYGINQLINTKIVSFFILSLIIIGAIIIYRHLQKEHDENKKIFEQYKDIMDQSVIVSKTDPKGIITYVNEQFCKISGYSGSELIGRSHNIIRHPDSSVPFFKQMWKTIKSKKIWQGVIKNRSKEGKDYYVQSTIAPILNEENKVIEYIALREDITDLIIKKNIMKSKKERIDTLFTHIDEILIIKKDERFEKISDKFFDILPFNNLQEFNIHYNYLAELFENKKGYLQNMKNDTWIQEVLNNPNKISKAIIKDREGKDRTFWVKVKKVPFENNFFYLYSLIDISMMDENLSQNKNFLQNVQIKESKQEENKKETTNEMIFEKIKEDLKLPDEIILKLIEKFILSTQENLDKIEELIKSKNIEEIKILIHNIKGSAGTLRLKEISTIATQIESEIQENNLEQQLKKLDVIRSEIKKIKNIKK